ISFAVPLPSRRGLLAFTAREVLLAEMRDGGWQFATAPRPVMPEIESAAWTSDGTLLLASDEGGVIAVRPGSGGWPAATTQALRPPTRSDKQATFRIIDDSSGPLLATNAGLFACASAATRFSEDARGSAWSHSALVPRTLHAADQGRLWVQLHHPSQ